MTNTTATFIRPIATGDVAIKQAKMVLEAIDAGKVNSDPLLMQESLRNLADLVRPHDSDLADELVWAADDFLQSAFGGC